MKAGVLQIYFDVKSAKQINLSLFLNSNLGCFDPDFERHRVTYQQ